MIQPKRAAIMTTIRPASLFPAPEHNHGGCLDAAVHRAELAFETKGLKLTRLRRKILEEIAASHHAVGAYDILDSLARKGDRLALIRFLASAKAAPAKPSKPQPPVEA